MKKTKEKLDEHEREEWGGWKIVANMLDSPDKCGIYSTSKCYKELYDFVCSQKIKSLEEFVTEMQKRADTTPPGLLLNEMVNLLWELKTVDNFRQNVKNMV